jgi:hypothetical protein
LVNAKHHDVAPGRHSQIGVLVEAPCPFNLNDKHRDERIDVKGANGYVVAIMNWCFCETLDRESVRGPIGLVGNRSHGPTLDVRNGHRPLTSMFNENSLEKAWLRVDVFE